MDASLIEDIGQAVKWFFIAGAALGIAVLLALAGWILLPFILL